MKPEKPKKPNSHIKIGFRYIVRSPYKRGESWAFKIRDEKTGRVFQKSSRKEEENDARQEIISQLELEAQEAREEVISVSFKETFPKFLEYWCSFRELREDTRDYYQTIFNQALEPYFKNFQVDELTYGEVEDYMHYRKVARKNKMVTISKHIGLLRMFCKWAVRRGYLKTDPTEGIKSVQSDKMGTAISFEQAKALLNACQKDKIIKRASARNREWEQEFGGRRHLFLFVLFGLYAGLRSRNIYRCSWSKNVDLENDRLHFTAKEMKGKRDHEVPIHPTFKKVLLEELENRDDLKIPVIGRDISTSVKKGFETVFKEAGITHLRPHDLKHSFSTWIEPLCPFSVWKSLLSHSPKTDISLLYSHPTWDQKVEAINKLPDLLDQSGGNETALIQAT